MALRIKRNATGTTGVPSTLEYGELAVDGAGNLYVGDVNGVPKLVNEPPPPPTPTATLQSAYDLGNTIAGAKPVVISKQDIPDLAQPNDVLSVLTFYNPSSENGIASAAIGGMQAPSIGYLVGKHLGSTTYVGNYTDGTTGGVNLGQSLETLAGVPASSLPIPPTTSQYWMVAVVEATDNASDSGIYFIHRVDDIGAVPRSGILLKDINGTLAQTFTSSTGRITLLEIVDMQMLNGRFPDTLYQSVTVGRGSIAKGIVNESNTAANVLEIVSAYDINKFTSVYSGILSLRYGSNSNGSATAPFIRLTGDTDAPDIVFTVKTADPSLGLTPGGLWYNDTEGAFKYQSQSGLRKIVFDLQTAAEESSFSLQVGPDPLTLNKDNQGSVPATLTFSTTSNGEEADIQLASRTSDPTFLTSGQIWFRSDENRVKYTDATSVVKSVPSTDEVALVTPGDAIINKAETLSPTLSNGDLAIEEDSAGNIYLLYKDSGGVLHRSAYMPVSAGGARPYGEISFTGNATAQSIGTSYTRVEGSYSPSPSFLMSIDIGSGATNGAIKYDGDFTGAVKVTCTVVISDDHTDEVEVAIAHYDASSSTTTYLSPVKSKQTAAIPWTVTLSTSSIVTVDTSDYFEIVVKGSIATSTLIESAYLTVTPL